MEIFAKDLAIHRCGAITWVYSSVQQ